MKKPSRAEAKRRASQARTTETQVRATGTQLAWLSSYTPKTVSDESWAAVKATHHEIMGRCAIGGDESFQKRARELAAYLAGRHERGESLALTDAMTFAAIDADYLHHSAHLGARSRNDRRSRLRMIAQQVNPGIAAPPRPAVLGHQPIKAPYTSHEELQIARVTLRARNPQARRQLCAIAGLCAGAGLDSGDLRRLRAADIVDRGDAGGIVVSVPQPRPRQVMVRRTYETHLRAGIDGLRPNQLVLGEKVDRRNIVSNIVDRAEILEDIPRIEASRLRSTWMLWLISQPIPLNVVLEAAGLKTARSLVDLLPYLPDHHYDPMTLREGTTQ